MSDGIFEHQSPLLCARCGVELTPGKGDFYVVRIEAVADPTPVNRPARAFPSSRRLRHRRPECGS
jgi:hypothetical protein